MQKVILTYSDLLIEYSEYCIIYHYK